MITLHNLGPAPGNRRTGVRNQPLDPLGPHLYRIEINHLAIAIFTHTRSDTLETFLRKAADAAKAVHDRQLARHASLSHPTPTPSTTTP